MGGIHVVVRVIRVESIPCGLSALVDERPGSLVVWLLESDWPETAALLMEQVLRAQYAEMVHEPMPNLNATDRFHGTAMSALGVRHR